MRRVIVMATLLGCGSGDPPVPAPLVEPPEVSVPTPVVTTEQRLEVTIRSGKLHDQAEAVDALAIVRIPKTAPLLYLALEASPNIRVKAARALADMRLHDAIPKLRAVLAKSRERDLELEVAMALYRLGDKDARAIVNSGTGRKHTTWRLEAALALADANDELARAPLADIIKTTPQGRDQWWRAHAGLAKLGDRESLALLEGQLTAKPLHALSAAKLLAHIGNAKGLDRLVALVAEKDFEYPEEAAFALAAAGDKRALAWLGDGLASPTPEDRKLALGIAAMFARDTASHRPAIAKLASSDPDDSVRFTAKVALIAF